MPTASYADCNSYHLFSLSSNLEISGFEYPSVLKDIVTQAGGYFMTGSLALSPLTDDYFESRQITPQNQEPSMNILAAHNNKCRNSLLKHMNKNSEWYKNLDFEDAIFIPNFIISDPSMSLYANASLPQRTESMIQVILDHVAPKSQGISRSKVGLRPPSPQYTAGFMIERTIETTLLTPPTSTYRSFPEPSTNAPNRPACRPEQSFSWRIPPFPQTPLSPASSTEGRSSRNSKEFQKFTREIMAEQGRVDMQRGFRTPRTFVPSRVVLERNSRNLISPWTSRLNSPTDPKHYGQQIPVRLNCAIFITGIPIQATYADVLGSVHGGKVYACRFEPDTGKFPTRAAKLVFFTRASAELFMQRNNMVGIFVLGQRVRAIWNRIRYDAYASPHHSRVLNITALSQWMDSEFLKELFELHFDYDLERIAGVPCPQEGCTTRAWHFACLRAQAEFAKMVIERELNNVFKVEYGVDPCARPWF